MNADVFMVSIKTVEMASNAILAMRSLRAYFPELEQSIKVSTELANCALTHTFRNVGANGHSPTPVCVSCDIPVKVPGGEQELTPVGPPPKSAWEPNSARDVNRCKALMLEILRRAAHDWVLYRQHHILGKRELAEDAYIWLFDEDEDHPHWRQRHEAEMDFTSFLCICECLDLDPGGVRARVRQMDVRTIMSSGRPAETRRVKKDTAGVEEHAVSINVDVNAPSNSEYVSEYESYGSVATPSMLSLSDVQGSY